MTNERLRAAMADCGLTSAALADRVHVDPKTVDRWIGSGRVPYRTTVAAVAQELDREPTWLWPETVTSPESELVHFYPHRAVVPRELWSALLMSATERIEVLAFAGLFFVEENPDIDRQLVAKASAGVQVRFLLGDPASEAIRHRGDAEGIGDALPAKARNVLTLLRPILDTAGIAVHLHSATLYASLYRFDDQMLVNTHLYGVGAYMAPVLHLRDGAGALFSAYERSFERVWETSYPYEPEAES